MRGWWTSRPFGVYTYGNRLLYTPVYPQWDPSDYIFPYRKFGVHCSRLGTRINSKYTGKITIDIYNQKKQDRVVYL